MIDLEEASGLPIVLDEEGMDLEFGNGMVVETRRERTVGEMRDVLADTADFSDDTIVYRMYDGVYRLQEKDIIKPTGIRYDLTLIYPGTIGSEYIKTLGHYHSVSDDQKYGYPELYEVLYGEVHFLVQKEGAKKGEIADAAVLIAGKGQRIIVPPEYGHVAVNQGPMPLVLANWIAEACTPNYGDIAQCGGAAIFEKEVNGTLEIVPNEKYSFVPPVRTINVDEYRIALFNMKSSVSLYDLIIKDPNCLDWLRYPIRKIEQFEKYIEGVL